MDANGWAAFARDAGLGLPLVRRRVAELSGSVKSRIHEVEGALARPGLDDAALSRFAEIVADRAERCAHTVKDSSG